MSAPLKIASYNIRKAMGIDRRRDPARILQVLGQIDADVVVLQEADLRLGPRPAAIPRFLIAQETDYEVVPLARNEVSLGWHGNAIFVRRGLEVTQTARIELPGLEPRGAVMARVEGVNVVGAHLGLLRRYRLKQMSEIRDHLGDLRAEAAIFGDFNEWSDVRGYEPWERDFTLTLPGRSYHASRPFVALDGVAYGSSLTLHAAGVEQSGAARRASDHLPIWAELTRHA
ncbi:metal-dependent hydrolase [Salipiger sp. CCB-MM3]|uniref:endonuclease/exonuclease/phosphatase family protein n=1 Tax=Salipiger sp. CCB-MM3 TaxID=1792508 RepID=UPI00080A9C90|nr:endonuclease/exonuclease/phosphatase family protein [Salipiger sp. CCB-MM3]ANT59758.1 metal-dependent hydrolase [Salipiger sp. CCB-MM3]